MNSLHCETCMRAGRTYEYVEYKDGIPVATHFVCGTCLDALIYAEETQK